MFTRKPFLLIAAVLMFAVVIVALAACQRDVPVTPEEPAGLANPASVYCEDQGYTLEIRTQADGGQYGVCLFDDGTECEEWAYYRGECAPGQYQHAEDGMAAP